MTSIRGAHLVANKRIIEWAQASGLAGIHKGGREIMASRGINKVILIGNLGQDPEVRYMPNGGAVANITVATSESWKDQQGQQQERTEWHRCVLYRRLAEIAGEYLKKGRPVYVEGRLKTRKWQDKDGNDRYTTEIEATEMQMLSSRQSGGQSDQGEYQPPPSRPAGGNASQQQRQPQRQAYDDLGDDIPF